MSIIADALRKSQRENEARGREAVSDSPQPQTSVSGRWKLMAELRQNNADLRAFLTEALRDEELPDDPAETGAS